MLRTVLTAVLLGFALVGCGQHEGSGEGGPKESADERIIGEYLADYPEIQSNHEHWHLDTDRGLPNYGEQFLAFHRDFIAKHNDGPRVGASPKKKARKATLAA